MINEKPAFVLENDCPRCHSAREYFITIGSGG